MPKRGEIRVGIGGWTYEPWRDNFYPADLTQKRELEYASRHVTAIEINGTFYRTPTAASFAKWRDETPDDFIFSVKVLRYITVRRVLAEARYYREHVLPWVNRRLRGRSSGDDRTGKYLDWTPIGTV